ncbi:MAG: hypothetical protein E6J61_14485 [Deltaproteobacteria bacterium]|nr:MAG: hypothetical protein E6J61_14485 [Deltaproteobacteria bacterium]
MRSLALVSLVALALGEAAAGEKRAAPKAPGKGRTGMFFGSYEPPTKPEHEHLRDRLRKARALEQFSEALSALRLPEPLRIKFASCDGESNAWYEPSDKTVTFCYEYVADLEQASGGAAAHGIPAEVAFMGGVAFVLLHETSHALFDLLEVPILGREEDAADNVAAFLLLSAGEGIARRVLSGATWMYLQDSMGQKLDESDFSDVHGLGSQRFYNVLCIAYGSNPQSFQGIVAKGYLPKERAESCGEEFRQVAYAMKKLVAPNVDATERVRIRAAHKRPSDAPGLQAQPAGRRH